jgi:hypothetical protein
MFLGSRWGGLLAPACLRAYFSRADLPYVVNPTVFTRNRENCSMPDTGIYPKEFLVFSSQSAISHPLGFLAFRESNDGSVNADLLP